MKRSIWRRAHHPTRISTLILIAIDVVALTVTSIVLDWTPKNFVGFLFLLLLALMGRGYYRTRMQTDLAEDAASIAVALAVAGAVAITFLAFDSTADPKLSTMVEVAFISFAVLIVTRLMGYAILRAIRRRGHLRSRAILVGTDRIAVEIAIEMEQRPSLGVDIVGHIPIEHPLGSHDHLGPDVGPLETICEAVSVHRCDRVIFSTPSEGNPELITAIRDLLPAHAAVFVLPQLFQVGLGNNSLTPDTARGYALVRIGRSSHPQIALRLKRLLDIVGSAILLLLLSPLLAVLALVVKLSSPGPILFRQERLGQNGKRFNLLKFRSMHVNNDDDTAWTPDLSSGGGVTRVGRILRATSLDELPQLFNILRGQMSFVGPRPERPTFAEAFTKTIPYYDQRHRMPSGLTGLAQVQGLRGDTPLEERVKYDNLYIDQWSLAYDFRIVLRTIWSILRQGAYAEAELDLRRALNEGDTAALDRIEHSASHS